MLGLIGSEGVKCLPAYVVAGNRNNNSGSLNNVGSNGNYWSSTVNGINSRNLNFNSSNANVDNSNNRANGFSARCMRINGAFSAQTRQRRLFF